jgi:hypothetical protein
VAVAVNQLRVVATDGDNGNFVAGLGNRGANYFHLATPGGKLVAGMWLSGANVDNKSVILAALKKWRALPKSERNPGSVKVMPPKNSALGLPKPPANGLVLRVYTRNLKRDHEGKLARITKADVQDRKTYKHASWRWSNGIYREPMPDVMWLTEAEWKSLVSKTFKKGDQFPVPAPVAKRLIRYHLIDGTYGLPFQWKLGDIQTEKLMLTVEDVKTSILRLRLQGKVVVATKMDLTKGTGFDARVEGILNYDPQKQRLTRFDILAIGDVWGPDFAAGTFSRTGRAPLGIAFELARGDKAADLVPPKGQNFNNLARHYFNAHTE